jgi:hypothetical protein
MMHWLHEAMRDGHFPPMGGDGKTVEIDGIYVGGLEKNKPRSNAAPRDRWRGQGSGFLSR